jgi:hypothetical protein
MADDAAQDRPRAGGLAPSGQPAATEVLPSGGMPDSERNWVMLATRAVLVVAGVVMLGIGATSALREASIGVTAIPIVAGFLLVLTPFVLDRLEELPLGEADQSLRLTRTVRELGAGRTAKILESTDLVRFADSYGFINHVLDGPQYRAAKVHLQDTLISRAAEIAMTNSFDPIEVRRLFRDGPPVVRALALGLMDGDLALADADSVISAVADSRSANEQLHGLQLASRTWHKLTTIQRQAILDHVKADPRIAAHSDRARLAEELQQRGVA